MNYPSISKILRYCDSEEKRLALKKWRESIGPEEAEKIRKHSFQRGNELDSMAKAYFESGTSGRDDLDAILRNYKFISREQKIQCKKFRYQGRYDALFEFNGGHIINDFKGSAKPKNIKYQGDWHDQLGAYYNALKEYGIFCAGGTIINYIENSNQFKVFQFSKDELESFAQSFISKSILYHNGQH